MPNNLLQFFNLPCTAQKVTCTLCNCSDAVILGDPFEERRKRNCSSSKTTTTADSSQPTARQETNQLESGSRGDRTDETVSIRLDAETLDCPVCFEPMKPPIHQCTNGHVVCFACHEKLTKKCHVCSSATTSGRCIALEKVINSVKYSCVNALYGCQASFSSSERGMHETVCAYAPCFCPEQTCKFKGSREALIVHLQYTHNFEVRKFLYNTSVTLCNRVPSVFLTAPDTSLFRVDAIEKAIGTTVSVVCIRPANVLEPKFSCEITVTKCGSTSSPVQTEDRETIDGFLQLKYDVPSSTMESGLESTGPYMVIPPCMLLSSGNFSLECRIEKKQ